MPPTFSHCSPLLHRARPAPTIRAHEPGPRRSGLPSPASCRARPGGHPRGQRPDDVRHLVVILEGNLVAILEHGIGMLSRLPHRVIVADIRRARVELHLEPHRPGPSGPGASVSWPPGPLPLGSPASSRGEPHHQAQQVRSANICNFCT